ncbi:hypothetical protein BH11PLA1_BH11PLA1_06250 [soil metagenome]
MSQPRPSGDGHTLVHVSHEATEHMGGIGTVLAGLLTAPAYRRRVARSILIAPLFHADRRVSDPRERLGESALECCYSGLDHHDPEGLSAIFNPIEWALGTRIVYGKRRLHAPGHEPADAEVLLLDVTNPDPDQLAASKWALYSHFGLDSQRYEHGWDYEEYCRLAHLAYHTLSVLLHPQHEPAVVVAHEYMGMCTALRCALDRRRFRTLFHAHECTTARRIVERLPGFDSAFYPAMRAAQAQGRFVTETFGDQSDFARHALVSRVNHLDATLAVGPETAAELRFLSPQVRDSDVWIAYNGLPAPRVTLADKRRSRARIDVFLERTIGFVPDVLVTHVTRPVPSKGMWRDIELMSGLAARLHARGQSCAYLLITCGGPVRAPAHVDAMARDYGWPAHHRIGYPDLVGPEVELSRAIERLNESCAAQGVRARGVLVNQFGFSRERAGPAVAEGTTIADLRLAADVELGMSTYEPFGIAQLEPLFGGAICLPSSVCGCLGLVTRAMRELNLTPAQCPVVLPADFTDPADLPPHLLGAQGGGDASLLALPAHMNAADRHHVEARVCARLADELAQRLPRTEAERERLLDLGQRLAERMSWDVLAESDFLPAVQEVLGR